MSLTRHIATWLGFPGRDEVFLSYRREDTEADALSLFNYLAERLGRKRIFRDLGSLEGGERWKDRLAEALAQCKAAIILIGPSWLSMIEARAPAHQAGTQTDYVYAEIESVLKAGATGVIPVLVRGARLPDQASLPPGLRALRDWNAITINHSSDAAWYASNQEIIDGLRKFGVAETRRRGQALFAVAGVLFAFGLAWFAPWLARVPQVPPGARYEAATQAIGAAGLSWKRVIEEVKDEQSQHNDEVVRIEPSPGTRLKRGASVSIVVYQTHAYPLACRGGGAFTVQRGQGLESFVLGYEPGRAPASRAMRPGTCAWQDRGLNPIEGNMLVLRELIATRAELMRTDQDKYAWFCAFYDPHSRRLIAAHETDFLEFRGGQWQVVDDPCPAGGYAALHRDPPTPTPVPEVKPTKNISDEQPRPQPHPEETKTATVNLIGASNGGTVIIGSSQEWTRTILGPGHHEVLGGHNPEEAVFAFRDNAQAEFDTFKVLVSESRTSNLKAFELFVSSSADGPFASIGRFETQNVVRFDDRYQAFKFQPVKAKYLKIRLLSNHNGYDHPFEVEEFQLSGRLEDK